MISYTSLTVGPWRVCAREGLEEDVALALASPGRLLKDVGGRGAITVHPVLQAADTIGICLPHNAHLILPPELIVRQCLRGGLVRHFLRKGYLFGNRPFAEFLVHGYLESHGLPVPPLGGVAWRRDGMVLLGRLITLRVKGRPLHDCLREGLPESCMEEVGRRVRQMHDLGVGHPDLNVHNILVDDASIFLLDFDKCRRYPHLSQSRRTRDLARFRRSLEKQGHGLGYFAQLLQGYGPIELPAWLKV